MSALIFSLEGIGGTYPIIGKSKVVNHARKWRLQPHCLCDFAFGVNDEVAYIACRVTLGLITHRHHIFGDGIKLWVSGEGTTLHLTMEVPGPIRLESIRVHGVWRAVLFTRKQHTIMINDVRVGSGPDLEINGVRILITVLACQGASCRSFFLKLLGINVSLFEVDMAIFNAESADNAISIHPLAREDKD